MSEGSANALRDRAVIAAPFSGLRVTGSAVVPVMHRKRLDHFKVIVQFATGDSVKLQSLARCVTRESRADGVTFCDVEADTDLDLCYELDIDSGDSRIVWFVEP